MPLSKIQMPAVGRYEVIAFVTGFSLMAYELAASRILAPSIGSSTYVWTSVIGVIIAALSLGYAVGGIVADRRVAVHDIAWLLLASAFGVVVTLALSDDILAQVSSTISDPRLQGLTASILLFMPASFIIGMISPYLVRLRNVSIETTGRSVASLSALNSVGGIVGTFCVGFIFFGFIGSKQTLAFVVALLLATSWLLVPKHHLRWRTVTAVFIVLIMSAQLTGTNQPHVAAAIDTPSSHYRVMNFPYYGHPIRALIAGPQGAQSGIYTNGSKELVFDYAKQMAEIIEKAPKTDTILILGGGAFTIPQYLAEKYPSSQIDVVEIDPQLVTISKQHFDYRDHANVKIFPEDARAFLNKNTQKYDVILVDVYNEMAIPFSLATKEYAKTLKESLQPTGIVTANIIGSTTPSCLPLLNSMHTTNMTAFSDYRFFPQADDKMETWQNIVMVYANTPLERFDALDPAKHTLAAGTVLTDNFAPLEQLRYQCGR